MPGTLQVVTLPASPVGPFLAHANGLLQVTEREATRGPTLLLAPLLGDAVVLGRHQRLKSAIAVEKLDGREVVRRSSGGRALLTGTGALGVALVVPEPGALTGERIGFDKFLNRAVRGLLAGLTRAGATGGAHYFGRDFASANGEQLAVVGQENGRRAAMFEAFVAVERSLELPAALNNYVEHGDPRVRGPAHTTLVAQRGSAIAAQELGELIADGYARAHGLELTRTSLDVAPVELPPAAEDEVGFEDSGVADIPIGFLEALVRVDGDRAAAARIRGDFMAPAFVIQGLEQSLAGAALTFEDLGPRVDAAFHQPGAFIFGMRELRVMAEAVLAAAGRL